MTFICGLKVRLFYSGDAKKTFIYFSIAKVIISLNHEVSAPVAQLDRVLDYESRGRGFESSPVRHVNQRLSGNSAGPFVFTVEITG